MAADLLCMSLALAGVLAGAGVMFVVIARNPSKKMDKTHD